MDSYQPKKSCCKSPPIGSPWENSFLRAMKWSIPAVVASSALFCFNLSELQVDYQLTYGLDNSIIWASATGALFLLLAFRTRQAFERYWEGTSLLHQMRAEWFDSVSCCLAFTRTMKEECGAEVRNFRHTLVRLTSLMHGVALEAISHRDAAEDFIGVFDVVDVQGLDERTTDFLRRIHEESQGYEECRYLKVEVVFHMIQVLITHHWGSGVLRVPAPIMSRVYQTFSRGLVVYVNARKITDTVFPVAYVKLINILLGFVYMSTPIIANSIVDHVLVVAVVTFIPVFGLFSMHFIASEIEDPFGTDMCDLPVTLFQADMNRSLLMLLNEEIDHICSTKKDAMYQWRALWEQHREYRSDGDASPSLGDSAPDGTADKIRSNTSVLRHPRSDRPQLSFDIDTFVTDPTDREDPKGRLRHAPHSPKREYLELWSEPAVKGRQRENPEAIARAVVNVSSEEAGTASSEQVLSAMTAGVAAQMAVTPLREEMQAMMSRLYSSLDQWNEVGVGIKEAMERTPEHDAQPSEPVAVGASGTSHARKRANSADVRLPLSEPVASAGNAGGNSAGSMAQLSTLYSSLFRRRTRGMSWEEGTDTCAELDMPTKHAQAWSGNSSTGAMRLGRLPAEGGDSHAQETVPASTPLVVGMPNPPTPASLEQGCHGEASPVNSLPGPDAAPLEGSPLPGSKFKASRRGALVEGMRDGGQVVASAAHGG